MGGPGAWAMDAASFLAVVRKNGGGLGAALMAREAGDDVPARKLRAVDVVDHPNHLPGDLLDGLLSTSRLVLSGS